MKKWAGNGLSHPPYSSDLVPNDFHLFGPLKEALHRKRFQNNEDVLNFVKNWLKHPNRESFAAGIKKFLVRWNKCVRVQGDYAEK